jgi:mono/diheme cytochrome c family protein
MKNRSLAAAVAGGLLAAASLAGSTPAQSPAANSATAPKAVAGVLDGKTIFLAQKCNLCHAVSSAQIKATSKIKAPDLSTVSLKDAAEVGKYLRKAAAINGKKHAKAFTGSDEEMGALISWLQKQGKAAS